MIHQYASMLLREISQLIQRRLKPCRLATRGSCPLTACASCITEVARLQEAECDAEVIGMAALRGRWLQQRLTESSAVTQRVELFLHDVRVHAAGADELA